MRVAGGERRAGQRSLGEHKKKKKKQKRTSNTKEPTRGGLFAFRYPCKKRGWTRPILRKFPSMGRAPGDH